MTVLSANSGAAYMTAQETKFRCEINMKMNVKGNRKFRCEIRKDVS